MVLNLKKTEPGIEFFCVERAQPYEMFRVIDLYVDGSLKTTLTADNKTYHFPEDYDDVSIELTPSSGRIVALIETPDLEPDEDAEVFDVVDLDVGQVYQIYSLLNDAGEPVKTDIRDWDDLILDRWLEGTEYSRYIRNIAISPALRHPNECDEYGITITWSAFTPEGACGEPAIEIGVGNDGTYDFIILAELPDTNWDLLRAMDFFASCIPELEDDEDAPDISKI